jgi:transcription initiation factor IIE alpha subunit
LKHRNNARYGFCSVLKVFGKMWRMVNMEMQENSFPCKRCGVVYTEESGAYSGFVCEDCIEGDKNGN